MPPPSTELQQQPSATVTREEIREFFRANPTTTYAVADVAGRLNAPPKQIGPNLANMSQSGSGGIRRVGPNQYRYNPDSDPNRPLDLPVSAPADLEATPPAASANGQAPATPATPAAVATWQPPPAAVVFGDLLGVIEDQRITIDRQALRIAQLEAARAANVIPTKVFDVLRAHGIDYDPDVDGDGESEVR